MRARLPPLPPGPADASPAFASPAAAAVAASPASAAASSLSAAWVPSRLPFRCSSVLLRGGPLLQGVDVDATRLFLDLHKATLNLQLKWDSVAEEPAGGGAEAASPSPSRNAMSPAASSSDTCTSPPARSTSTHSLTSSSKKRSRHEKEEADDCEQMHAQVASLPTPTAHSFNGPTGAHASAATSFLLTPPPHMAEQPPSSKRGRTHVRTPFALSPCSYSYSPQAGAGASTIAGNKSLWSIPLSHVVGVDFAISLDQPGTCTLALKPQCVYNSTERLDLDHPSHSRQNSGSALANLPLYSPARLLVSSYQSAAAKNPARFTPLTLFIQRMLPPLLYWIWLHSTYTACAFLLLGCVVTHVRFWLTAMTCFSVYLILLLQEFRRSQQDFRMRLQRHRAPQDECLYVHLIFAHDSYTSFLSFRRLFVAAAPAFSAPSASSSDAIALIPPDLVPSTSSLLWSPARPSPPQRYPISHLQRVLPSAPLFFGNVYVDFIMYLLLPPRLFASAQVRSVTHFLLPVLYLGQAMVAAVRALSPVAVQGFLYLSPYLHVELLWFFHILDSFPNPLPWILPLDWIRSVLGSWILLALDAVWRSWGRVTHVLFVLSAPLRWVNNMLSPVLELIRQEARALWGLTILAQPVVAILMRLQTELMRLWGALSAIVSVIASSLGAVLPGRLFALFGAVKSSASATAAVGSGIQASGGFSRWRQMWMSVQDAATLIGKWKLVIDRIRLNIQLYYYEHFVHVRDAQNLAGHASNPNFQVPLVVEQALMRTQSELAEVEMQLAEGRRGGSRRAINTGESIAESDPTCLDVPSRDVMLLTPRRSLTPVSSPSTSPSTPSRRGSANQLPSSVQVHLPIPGSAPLDLPSPPTFVFSPLQDEPPVFEPGVQTLPPSSTMPARAATSLAAPSSPPQSAMASSASSSTPFSSAPSSALAARRARRATLGTTLASADKSLSSAKLFSGFDAGYEQLLGQQQQQHPSGADQAIQGLPGPTFSASEATTLPPPPFPPGGIEDAATRTTATESTSESDASKPSWEFAIRHRGTKLNHRRQEEAEHKEHTP